MKLLSLLILFSDLLLFVSGATAQNIANAVLPDAHVIVHTVDQDRKAIPDVSVGVAGTISPNPKPETFKKGLTDETGAFEVQLKSNGEIHVTADKPGYYRTEISPAYSYQNTPGAIDTAFASGLWEPRDVTLEISLKKIINPVPMYAQRVNRGIPSRNENVGFDLFDGDFVAPYGRGKSADMIFRWDINEREKNDYDSKFIVTFPNKMDGILPFSAERPHGSRLRSSHAVPPQNLLPEWTVVRSRRPGRGEKSNYDPEHHGYFFRVRTVVDSNGKIVSANYGKIYGDFMNFTYYLNPTPNDRNVEFDPKRNLFTNLKPAERVTAP